MGEPNRNVVTRWAEAVRRGDLAEELWHPDPEIVNAKGWVLESTYRGYEGLRRWWADLAEAFSDFAMEVDEITPLGEERFLTVQRFVGHFRHTEIPFDAEWASVITVRAGRIVQAVGYVFEATRTEGARTGTGAGVGQFTRSMLGAIRP